MFCFLFFVFFVKNIYHSVLTMSTNWKRKFDYVRTYLCNLQLLNISNPLKD